MVSPDIDDSGESTITEEDDGEDEIEGADKHRVQDTSGDEDNGDEPAETAVIDDRLPSIPKKKALGAAAAAVAAGIIVLIVRKFRRNNQPDETMGSTGEGNRERDRRRRSSEEGRGDITDEVERADTTVEADEKVIGFLHNDDREDVDTQPFE